MFNLTGAIIAHAPHTNTARCAQTPSHVDNMGVHAPEAANGIEFPLDAEKKKKIAEVFFRTPWRPPRIASEVFIAVCFFSLFLFR